MTAAVLCVLSAGEAARAVRILLAQELAVGDAHAAAGRE
jgi:hypothetical protein